MRTLLIMARVITAYMDYGQWKKLKISMFKIIVKDFTVNNFVISIVIKISEAFNTS